jgi:xylose isomerase
MKLNINTHIGALGTFGERYVPSGYYQGLKFEKQLDIISKIDGLTGLALWFPGHPLIDDPGKLKSTLDNYNIKVADIYPDIWSDKKWKYGPLASSDKKIKKEAIAVIKHTIDLAVELDAYSVCVWPAHAGFDYSFQENYAIGWSNLLESFNEIGDYNPKVKVAIEYKQKDPRSKAYIENFGKAMTLIKSIKAENIGVALDLGHSFFAGEKPAETLLICDQYKKLYQIHLNDNYRDADPDLLFGTINFWDTLEFFYWLSKLNFDGWLNIDTVCPRDDREKMLKLAVKLVKDYERIANKLNKHSEIIDNNLLDQNFAENMMFIRDIIFAK